VVSSVGIADPPPQLISTRQTSYAKRNEGRVIPFVNFLGAAFLAIISRKQLDCERAIANKRSILERGVFDVRFYVR